MKAGIRSKMTVLTVVITALLAFSADSVSRDKIKAFPEAEGLGCYAMGGRGGKVLYVTNLNDRGPGSLRAAVEAEGPRIVLFKTSGVIVLKSNLSVDNPYITIAGQTAPGDGICLKDRNFSINTHDVIVRHLRIRLGDESSQESDAVTVAGQQVVMDHISASWSIDEVFSLTGKPDSVSVQWCMITEALRQSKHHKGKHSYGSLIKPRDISHLTLHHNLYAHNDSRNPRPGNYGNKVLYLDFINNVIYDYGARAGYSGGGSFIGEETFPEPVMMNYIGNFLRAGPSSLSKSAFNGGSVDTWIYQYGNQFNGHDSGWGMFSGAYSKLDSAFEIAPDYLVSVEDAGTAFDMVLEQVGAILPAMDAVDRRIRQDVMNGTGKLIDSQTEVGGWPTYHALPPKDDTDQDGMPDFWEAQYGLAHTDASDQNGDADVDGYTNLEEYLNNTDPFNTGSPILYVATTVNRGIKRTNQSGAFTLWRTGDTSKALPVSVTISGMKNAPSRVTIPAGANKVTLEIPCQDVLDHQVQLTLIKNETFKIGCPADGLITMLD